MPLLRLAGLVASMPSWIALIINQDELELGPPAGQGQYQQPTVDSLLRRSRRQCRNSPAGATDQARHEVASIVGVREIGATRNVWLALGSRCAKRVSTTRTEPDESVPCACNPYTRANLSAGFAPRR